MNSGNSLAQNITDMRAIFKDVDAGAADFQRAFGLECLKMCGHCCENPVIEATALEMLPLAATLLEQGTVEDFYVLAEKQGFKGPCVFFQPACGRDVPGHCRVYEHRPLVCRLFGSSGNKDKYGHIRLVMCAPIKEAQPERFERAQVDAAAGRLVVPVMADPMMRVMAVDPQQGRENFPINMAFKKAADRVYLCGLEQ